MAVSEANDHAVGGEVAEFVDGIGCKARLRLFSIGDNRRPGGFEVPDRVADRAIINGIERLREMRPALNS